MKSLKLKAGIVSLVIFRACLGIWFAATQPAAGGSPAAVAMTAEQAEYNKMMGKDPGSTKTTGFPTLGQMGTTIWKHVRDPFYDNGPNDKGILIQLGFSLARVGLGFLLAALVAVPLGFVIGMSPLLRRALPLALYTIKDSSISGIFVIFICSVWPMLINTAFGVSAVKREWLNVAATLEVTPLRKAFLVILPAAAPTILTGMRISMGIAWLVIVAAEMLVGGTGIGYFVWNEWNNLSLTNVIFAIGVIGIVGMLLDMVFGQLQKMVTYVE
jgi:nitrate/nitrite transport system permease protein